MEFLSALVLGLMGSFHCIGMCGPIAVALPLKVDSWGARITSGLLYNIGRTITYALLGAIFGLVGKGLSMGGLQRWASIGIGAVMILSVLFPIIFRKVNIEKATYGMVSRMKGLFGKMFAIRSYGSLFVIGILNGFLPCGLVYIAIAGAIVTGDIQDGILYMTIFGLGTIPVMLSVSLIGNIISVKFRNKIKKIFPIFIVIIGILFILRGLGLGIKYISPKPKMLEPTRTEMKH